MDTVAPKITGKKVAPSAKARGKVPQSRGPPKKRRQGRLTLTIPECAQLLGIGRNAAYRAAENGELGQILRVGKLFLVPRQSFIQKFGFDEAEVTALMGPID
jgi:excisionase family DNA binding protein